MLVKNDNEATVYMVVGNSCNFRSAVLCIRSTNL